MRIRIKALALLVACATAGIATVPVAVHAEDLTVKVGFAAPLTGANAGYGKDLQNGVQLALDEATKKITIGGKTAKFVIQAKDDQADPRIGVQAAQKLVDDGVAVVIGHFNSGTTLPASPIYDNAGIPMIDPAAPNPTITTRGLQNVFTMISSDAQNAGNASIYAVTTTKAKHIAIIDDRTAFGQGEADEFEKAVKAKGGNIVAREFSDNQTVDFSAQLTRLKAVNANLIFFGGLDRQAAAVVKRMKQLGVNAQFGSGGVIDADFLKLAGDAAEGTQAWEYGSPLDKLPQGKAFSDKFQKRFGVAILSYAPFGYDAAWAATNAMQKANSIGSEQVPRDAVLRTASPHDRLDARDEFAGIEGLDNVIVGARRETTHLVLDGTVRGEHQHGHAVAAPPQAREQFLAAHRRQPHVEQRGVVALIGQDRIGEFGVRHMIDDERFRAQQVHDPVRQFGAVFNEQEFHCAYRLIAMRAASRRRSGPRRRSPCRVRPIRRDGARFHTRSTGRVRCLRRCSRRAGSARKHAHACRPRCQGHRRSRGHLRVRSGSRCRRGSRRARSAAPLGHRDEFFQHEDDDRREIRFGIDGRRRGLSLREQ